MKIPKAALLAVLGATTAAAFTPSNLYGVQSTALRSTTVKNDDIFKETKRNGAVEKDVIEQMAKQKAPPKKAPALSKAVLEAQASRKTRAAVSEMMKQYKNQSGAAIVYSKLIEHGVEVVNGYSGGAVLPLLDQFHLENPRHKDAGYTPIKWITNSNEAPAGHIAEGFAKSMPSMVSTSPLVWQLPLLGLG